MHTRTISDNTYDEIRFFCIMLFIVIRTYVVIGWSLGKDTASLKSPDVLLSNVQGAIGLLLPALFESPVMGVALLDSQFRFRAINGALAAMNGLPVFKPYGEEASVCPG